MTFERFPVASDYEGLKQHIIAVSKRQETEDRRYRSSLYLGTPGPSNLLGFTGAGELFFFPFQCRPIYERTFDPTGRDNRRRSLRPSSIYSLTVSHPMRQPHMSMRAYEVGKREPVGPDSTHKPQDRAATFTPLSRLSISVSSQSKTLSVPAHEVYSKVNEAELDFLLKLDSEVEKVESFYLDREKEVKTRYES